VALLAQQARDHRRDLLGKDSLVGLHQGSVGATAHLVHFFGYEPLNRYATVAEILGNCDEFLRHASSTVHNAALRGEVERLQQANQQLQARVRELAARVEELRRAAKRQAAPFSKNTPAPDPKRPGRKPGAADGRCGRRPVPQRVDRVVSVGLPLVCPHCGDQLAVERVACQYQEDLPRRRRR